MTTRRPPEDLTGKQRRHLRGLSHGLQPIVQVGHQGVTDAVAEAIEAALEHHELIKVRLGKNAPDRDKKAIGADLEARLGGHVVQALGRVIVLYREAEEPEDRRIRLPPPNVPEPDAPSDEG